MFDYKEYFDEIKPTTTEKVVDRFLFAICSVHTTWENNVRGFAFLKDKLTDDINDITTLVKQSGLGLTKVRSKAIKNLVDISKKNPKLLTKRRIESWQNYADRLEKQMFGLGFAKTRFAIELLYPNSAKVCCVDTHIIQWAKQNPNKMNKKLYHQIEQGWLNHSKKIKTNPIEARWKWWDNKQGYDNPKYWSWCLK